MSIHDKIRLVLHHLLASGFALISSLLAVTIGTWFLGQLLSLTIGVSQFSESYYTRTMSLTTLLAFYAPETGDAKPFGVVFRASLTKLSGINLIVYHDIDFATIELSSGRKADVAVRSAIPNDPEIERLERVAGGNLPDFTDATRPTVVISLARAMKLSDSPAGELIGREIAVTFNRSLRMEDEPERESIYATVAGIVQESPDEAIYLPYQMLAAAHAWQRETIQAQAEPSKPAFPRTMQEDEPSNPHLVVIPFDDPELTVERLIVEAHGDQPKPIASHKANTPTISVGPSFRFAKIADAYASLSDSIADNSIVYPHLRIHCRDLDSLIAVRAKLREQNIPTTAVLDEIAAIRELHHYISMVGLLIGGITLLAAICSIFNTLHAAVERRTREIGILRALGASKSDVLTVFLIEGVAIGLLGSVIASGTIKIVSMQLNRIILKRLASDPDFQRLASLNPAIFAFPYWLPLVVVAVGGMAAFFAALFPAAKACSITPVDALRNAG